MGSNGRFNNVILLGSNHYASPVASANTHSIDLEASSSQYLSITDANQTGLDITGDMTIETWVNFETIGSDRFLLSKWDGSSNRSYLLFYKQSKSAIRFNVSSNGSNASSVDFSFTPTLSTWYHLAITYDASLGSAEMFVNGISQSTKTGMNIGIYDSTADFIIGSKEGTSFYFDGLIDDVRIWDVIRTDAEILANYNKELTGTESNLQGYWKLNNSANDLTSNGNDLTENNSPVYSTDVPF